MSDQPSFSSQAKKQWTLEKLTAKQWAFVLAFAVVVLGLAWLHAANSRQDSPAAPISKDTPEELEALGRAAVGGERKKEDK